MILNKKYLLKNTIDIYVTDMKDEKVLITFHKITTRDRIEILTNKTVAEFIALLNGDNSIDKIYSQLSLDIEMSQVKDLIYFLLKNKLITEKAREIPSSRYDRQEAFFDDLYLSQDGNESQELLSNKSIVFLGCGSFSGALAEILVRMGVGKITLVDYKKVTLSTLARHLYTRANDIGKDKINVLESYLKRIDPSLEVKKISTVVAHDSDLKLLIGSGTDLVINGLDEPYIGHTSLKIGRYLSPLKIPMYVMGGFDAHLMSSGELINPPQTPCIDCVQNSFQIALKDWTPYYNSNAEATLPTESLITGNSIYSGGLCLMSNFSAYLSASTIIDFFLSGKDSTRDLMIRYEYLPNKGEMTQFKTSKKMGCTVCYG